MSLDAEGITVKVVLNFWLFKCMGRVRRPNVVVVVWLAHITVCTSEMKRFLKCIDKF